MSGYSNNGVDILSNISGSTTITSGISTTVGSPTILSSRVTILNQLLSNVGYVGFPTGQAVGTERIIINLCTSNNVHVRGIIRWGGDATTTGYFNGGTGSCYHFVFDGTYWVSITTPVLSGFTRT